MFLHSPHIYTPYFWLPPRCPPRGGSYPRAISPPFLRLHPVFPLPRGGHAPRLLRPAPRRPFPGVAAADRPLYVAVSGIMAGIFCMRSRLSGFSRCPAQFFRRYAPSRPPAAYAKPLIHLYAHGSNPRYKLCTSRKAGKSRPVDNLGDTVDKCRCIFARPAA